MPRSLAGVASAEWREIEQSWWTAHFAAASLRLAEVGQIARGRQEDRHPPSRMMINQCRIGTTGNDPGRKIRTDGHELRFAVNCLAGFSHPEC